jgi:hypothetical protein
MASIASFIAGAIKFLRRPLFPTDQMPVWDGYGWGMVTLEQLGLGIEDGLVLNRDPSGNPVSIANTAGQVVGHSAPAITSMTQLPGMTVDLDATNPMFTTNFAAQCVNLGDPVSIIPDSSGNGHAPVTAGAPTYHPTAINGHPGIDMHGNSKFTLTALMTAGYVGALTIYVVAQTNGPLVGEQIIFGVQTPNFWLGVNGTTMAVDITMAGVTPLPVNMSNAGAIDTVNGVYAISLSATQVRFLQNRNFAGLGGSVSIGVTDITGSINFSGQSLVWGSRGVDFNWGGFLGRLCVFQAAHTDEQMRQANDLLVKQFSYSAKPFVLMPGNSLVSGSGSDSGATQNLSVNGNNLPGLVLRAGGGDFDLRTDAYPGRTLQQLIDESPHYGFRMYFPSTGQKQIAVVWEITNSLAGTQSRTYAYRKLVEYCTMLKDWGFDVVPLTCLDRKGVYLGFTRDALAINAQMRRDLAAGAYYLDDIADVAMVPLLQDPTNINYFDPDQTHLKTAGYREAEPVVTAAIRRRLAA